MKIENLVKINGAIEEIRNFCFTEKRSYRFREGSVFFTMDSEWIPDVGSIRELALKYPNLCFRVAFLGVNYRGIAFLSNREFRYHEEELDLEYIEPKIPKFWLEDFKPPLDDYFETV